MTTTHTLPWQAAGWHAQASAWITETLAAHKLVLSGPITQPHYRPWSTVLHVPTTSGSVYFKATGPALRHEPILTEALSRWQPDCMPQVIAIEPDERWMLLHDSGPTLRSLLKADQDLGHWVRVLDRYAQVQRDLSKQSTQLLSLGALDRRLEVLPIKFGALLADRDALLIDQPESLTAADYARLQALVPEYRAMCAALAAYGIPHTLHHDDFHDGNIFVRDGRYTFADWGESCVAHPFFTLVVTLRSIAYQRGVAEDAPEIRALRDAYLQPWASFGSAEQLVAACELARKIGMVNRALTWYEVITTLPEPFRTEQAEAVPGWLQEFLGAMAG